jgi:hypothetical protein
VAEPPSEGVRQSIMRLPNVSLVLLAAALCSSCSTTNQSVPSRSETTEPPAGAERETTQPGDRLTLQVGHCFVEPLALAGREWVTKRPYMGHGGGLPERFTDDGMFQIESATSALFIAEGGAEIAFKVAPDPLRVRGCR